MGCLASSPKTDDSKVQIPRSRKTASLRTNGSVKKQDFGIQIGTPFSKKRTNENGKLTKEDEDENQNEILLDNDKQPKDTLVDNSVDLPNDEKPQPDHTAGILLVENNVNVHSNKEVVETSVSVETNSSDTKTSSSESPFTLQQKWLLHDSWIYIKKDLLEFGMVFFSRLLEQNPGIKHLWSFGKMNYATEMELRKDASFQNHSRRVMEMIGSAIDGLEDLELLVPILSDLGERHKMYGAKPEHFKAVHEALIYSYQKGLDQRIWTVDVKDAWDTAITTIASVMSAKLNDDP